MSSLLPAHNPDALLLHVGKWSITHSDSQSGSAHSHRTVEVEECIYNYFEIILMLNSHMILILLKK